jgi:hypothetical protein
VATMSTRAPLSREASQRESCSADLTSMDSPQAPSLMACRDSQELAIPGLLLAIRNGGCKLESRIERSKEPGEEIHF